MQEFCEPDSKPFLEWLNGQWGIDFDSICEDVNIQGSPERTVSRAVFKDTRGHRFIIEKFDPKKYQIRLNVAHAVDYLNKNGLNQALSYNKTSDGLFLPFYKEACFQVSAFLDSTGVKRPDYLSSAAMGKSFAVFLIRLSKAAAGIDQHLSFEPFSIKNYIYQLFSQMKIHDTGIYEKFLPMLKFLEQEFMDVHDQLPLSFCHGDLHPLNVIWFNDRIKAVIDWEFTGLKPDIYDLANLVGCAGIEDPAGLGMPMVMAVIKQVRANRLYSDLGWRFFPEYMLALRFAWLSEWLRKQDSQMIEMEEAYMGILMDNMAVLKKGWLIEP
ncbi:MAG: phosphotransferase [Pseudomonadota bacterium]